jgi:hypothetical protein
MLKRVGIIVAASAACLFAVTPLAYAGNGHHGHGHGHGHHGSYNGNTQTNNNNTTQNPTQSCGNSTNSGVYGYKSSNLSNSDSHDGQCSSHNSVENNN